MGGGGEGVAVVAFMELVGWVRGLFWAYVGVIVEVVEVVVGLDVVVTLVVMGFGDGFGDGFGGWAVELQKSTVDAAREALEVKARVFVEKCR